MSHRTRGEQKGSIPPHTWGASFTISRHTREGTLLEFGYQSLECFFGRTPGANIKGHSPMEAVRDIDTAKDGGRKGKGRREQP